jgi:3'-phosphoadenosine 5'-phosphosulfate sulfotransferase (PAPS reductase)/FAD synthetase
MVIDEVLDAIPQWFGMHSNIMVSISGGSDSGVMLDMIINTVHDLSNVHFVFFDTGMEYGATLEHLDFLETKYGIIIERVKPRHNVPYVCTHIGVPFLSKYISEQMYRLQSHGFQWEDEDFDVLVKKYPNTKSALRRWCNMYGEGSRFNINKRKLLKEFIMDNPPTFNISAECCQSAKKAVSNQYVSDNNIDLVVTGVRKSEGGVRSVAYKSCYNEADGIGHYRPLWLMTQKDKEQYIHEHDVQLSRCYTEYGFKRTGCAGCPFDKFYISTLMKIGSKERKLHRLAKNLFGKSYDYTSMYAKYKHDHRNT